MRWLVVAVVLACAPPALGAGLGERADEPTGAIPSCGQSVGYTVIAAAGTLAFAFADFAKAENLRSPLPMLLVVPQTVFVDLWLAPAFDVEVSAGALRNAALAALGVAAAGFMAGLPMATDGVGAIFGAIIGLVGWAIAFPGVLASDSCDALNPCGGTDVRRP